MLEGIEPLRKLEEGFVGQMIIFVPQGLIQKAAANSFTNRLYITAIGYYPNASFHDRERESGSPHYIMLHCVAGKGRIDLQGKTIHLTPNTFIIFPKNVPHHYASSLQDPWSIYWVHFTGEHADFLFGRYKEAQLFDIPYDQVRTDLFYTIYHLVDNAWNERELEVCQIKFLDYLASFIYLKEIDLKLNEADVISQSIAFMKANLHQRLTLNDLAQQQLLSVSHYSRLFRVRTGSSPTHYFTLLKIQKSCQYLHFTDRNIKEICLSLGFDDPFYFSRLFKKMIGTSPANYKSQFKKLKS